MTKKSHAVVIVDDSEVERFLLKLALKDGAPRMQIVSELESGDEIIAYLAGEGRFADRQEHPLPKLVFLDLRMPRKSGLDVLEWLRERPRSGFKVAVLADSSGTTFRERALELGADYFFSKIAHGGEMAQMVRNLEADLDQMPDISPSV
jgi:DNA-binding NarL/FixJ family response regulator